MPINIPRRVKNFVNKYDTADPFRLAKELGIAIVRLPLPEDIRGFLVHVLRRKYIVLNESLCYAAEKITVCHELGHARLHTGYGYYLHPDSTYYIASKREREANEYAIHLLSYSTDIDGTAIAHLVAERHPDPKEVHKILGRFIETQDG